jgi:hypothetical protein
MAVGTWLDGRRTLGSYRARMDDTTRTAAPSVRRPRLWGRGAVALALVCSTLVFGLASPTPAGATIPPPPTAAQMGVVSVATAQTTNGGLVTLTTSLRAPAPYQLGDSVSCGSFGCIGYALLWQINGAGLTIESGCTGFSTTCVLRYTPNFVAQGWWAEVKVSMYLGQTLASDVYGYAIYAPPVAHTVQVRPVTAAGAVMNISGPLYLVRSGYNPLAADCVAPNTVVASLPSIPPCITFGKWWQDDYWSTTVPRSSGTWSVIVAPSDPTKALRSQTTAWKPRDVAVGTDNVETTVTPEVFPSLQVSFNPPTLQVLRGEVNTVRITVEATQGKGVLTGVRPYFPAGLALSAGASIEAVGTMTPTVPTDGFTFAPGQKRTFTVAVRGLTDGERNFSAPFYGTNEAGNTGWATNALAVSVLPPGSPTTSTLPPTGGGNAPQPPRITKVTRDPGSGRVPGVVIGTVAGAPGASVKVDIATHARCTRVMSGTGVRVVGSVTVKIGQKGTGSFRVPGKVAGGESVYGTVVSGGKRSDVSSCRTVPETTPPSAPRSVSVTPGRDRVKVTWKAPAHTGGRPLTGYKATAKPGGRACSTAKRSCVITGLTTGTRYTVSVQAKNAVGWSDASRRSTAARVR